MSSATDDLPLHTSKRSLRAPINRLFALIYICAILDLLYHHTHSLLRSTSLPSFLITLTFLVADSILAFMHITTQAFRINPLYRIEHPENLERLILRGRFGFPALDVFICTADPHKEPLMNVVKTALSVMAYDYAAEKVSVYVSDDGGSELTLFAFMEAAKFARVWLPFCRENKIVERCPEAFFEMDDDDHSRYYEAEKIKTMYQAMKVRVTDVIERGKVDFEFVTGERERHAFSKWTDGFTPRDHPAIIEVLLDSSKDKDVSDSAMPNLIYVSREKSSTSQHNFKAGAFNVRFQQRFRGINKNDTYGCAHKTIFVINPEGMDGDSGPDYFGTGCFFNRRAFFGPPSQFLSPETPRLAPHTEVDNTLTRSPEVLELAHRVAACNYEDDTNWGHKVSDPWFVSYVFLFLGSYTESCLEFIMIERGTFPKWWNDQRVWMIRSLSSFLFGSIEYLLNSLGISTHGFNVTNKVVDEGQSKRYKQGIFEFGVASPLTCAAIVNLAAFVLGHVEALKGRVGLEEVLLQMFVAGFGVVNCIPVYEGIKRSDKGRIPTKITTVSLPLLAFALYTMAGLC